MEEVVPIPKCAGLVAAMGCKTPEALADEMVRVARAWQGRNPGKDVMEVIVPDWKEYVGYRLNRGKNV